MLTVRREDPIYSEHDRGIALGAQHPCAELAFVGPQQEDRVVELARRRERPPSVAGPDNGIRMVGADCGRRPQDERRVARGPID